ncbi:MAG: YbaK/EbsC family protein, partial [Spirochaetota bacterium]
MSEKIQKEILKLKIDTNVIVFDKTTKTAKDAATALNCDVAQIVKSIVFKGKYSQKPILILVSG